MNSVVSALTVGGSTTLLLFLLAWSFGAPLGMVLAGFSFVDGTAQRVLKALSFLFGAVPLLVILFWTHYPLQSVLNVVWSPETTTILVLGLYVSFAFGDALFDALKSVDQRFNEAAAVLGLRKRIYIRSILLPNSLQLALPRLLLLAITTIQMTMFASLLGVEELFRATLRLNAELLRPIELFTIMAAFYIAICGPLYLLGIQIRKRLRLSGIDA